MSAIASGGAAERTMDLTVAVVSYNTKDLVLDCLESLCGTAGSERREVILVDNDSRDGTVAAVRLRYPQVLIIANSENHGFAKAVNQALAVGRGRYLLMLNSDTRATGEALGLMVA
jgi:GT2 family glycosyltransferase